MLQYVYATSKYTGKLGYNCVSNTQILKKKNPVSFKDIAL